MNKISSRLRNKFEKEWKADLKKKYPESSLVKLNAEPTDVEFIEYLIQLPKKILEIVERVVIEHFDSQPEICQGCSLDVLPKLKSQIEKELK